MASIKPIPSPLHCDDMTPHPFQNDLSELISKILKGKESLISEVAKQIFGEATPETVSQLKIVQPRNERVDFNTVLISDEYLYHNDVFLGTISYPEINGRLNIMFTPNEKLKAEKQNEH